MKRELILAYETTGNLVSENSELFLNILIDYVKELMGNSFKINNPQTKSSCGCGVSFSL